MNIVVDGRAFTKVSAGISTFLKCSLLEWAKQQPNNSFWVLLPHEQDITLEFEDRPLNLHFYTVQNRWLLKLPNLILVLLIIPFLIRKVRAAIYYSPVPLLPFLIPKYCKTLLVVHDVVNIEFANTMDLRNKIATKLFYNRSIKKCDFLWANSHYTSSKIRAYFPHRKSKEIYVGCSIDQSVFHRQSISVQEQKKIKESFGIKGRFLLFVGSLEPRKNLEFLLRLMPNLYLNYGVQLVVVGGKGWKSSYIYDIVNKQDFPVDSTIFCGFVSNEKLAKLYNIADSFISASFNEGFGMPQLEAIFCGCPVVTADNSAMSEVCKNKEGVYLVKGYEVKKWSEAIMNSLQLKKPTINFTPDYDWKIIIQKLIKKLN